jgi:molybdate-binding protein
MISSVTSSSPDVARTAASGFADAQASVQAVAEAVASNGADPAVILNLKGAEGKAGVSAAILKADQKNFQRLLDVLA